MGANDAYELVTDKLYNWLETLIAMLPNLLLAVLIMVTFVFVAKLVRKLFVRLLGKVSQNESINQLVGTILYIAVMILGLFIALGILNLDKTVTSLLAGAGIIGLALGFAFQDIAANFMSGILMALRKPIRIGDVIESKEFFGTVQSISLRSTEVMTPQGQMILIPNKEVFQNAIINYSKLGKRRIDLEIGVSYGEDLEKVKQVTIEAISKLEEVDKDRAVEVMYTGFGDSSINFDARYWISFTRQVDYRSALSNGIMAVKKAYNENDITIPFPIRTLDFGIKGGEKLNEILDATELSKQRNGRQISEGTAKGGKD
ncbi:MAG: mechanosensitive ion channel [Bacteroidia bacterium]